MRSLERLLAADVETIIAMHEDDLFLLGLEMLSNRDTGRADHIMHLTLSTMTAERLGEFQKIFSCPPKN